MTQQPRKPANLPTTYEAMLRLGWIDLMLKAEQQRKKGAKQ